MDNAIIRQFENHQIRSAWLDDEEQWYFSVVDVVGALSEQTTSRGASTYWAVLKKRLIEEGAGQLLTNCKQLKMRAQDGKLRKTDAAAAEQLLRIIQSIPSKKAEPFKQWLAKVGAERIQEVADPETAIQRAMDYYAKKGYSEGWIRQRLMSIEMRKELTNEWQQRGVRSGGEFAILTDEISRAWSGMSTREYKNLKGLTNQNLRDNMSNTELVLNMLAETTTTDISRAEKPEGFEASRKVARRGGAVAGKARQLIEGETGQPVITSMNALDFAQVIAGVLGEIADAARDVQGRGEQAD